MEKDEYCEVYQLNIDNFQFLDETGKPVEDMIETYSIQNDYKELYIRKFYINISLVNVLEKYYTCGKDGLEEWEKTMIVMFDTDEKRVLNIAEGNEEYMEYLEAVREFVKGYDLYESYDHRADERQAFIDAAAERGHLRGLEEGHTLGLEEGHTRGSQEAKREIAKSLLKDGMSNEKIQKITGLTESELDLIAVS